MSKTLSRRDLLKLAGLTSAGLALSACGLNTMEVSTSTPFPPTRTILLPTATKTLTPISPVATVAQTITPSAVLEIKMADLPQTKAAAGEFLMALKSAGIQGDIDQIRKGLSIKEITGKAGKKYEITVTRDGYPLMMKTEGGDWKEVALKDNSIGLKAYDFYGENFGEQKYQENFDANYNGGIFYGLNWKEMEKNQGYPDYQVADSTYSALLKKGVEPLGLHLLDPSFNSPDWLVSGSFTKDQIREFMKTRISTIMSKYDKTTIWSVVNEPFLAKYRENDPFYKVWGNSYDYIVEAFKIAKGVNPQVKLMYNDTDNHSQDGVTRTITRYIVKKLKEEGLIDVVGFQMHLFEWAAGHVDQQLLTFGEEIKYYQSMGVEVRITELDYKGSEAEISKTDGSFNFRLAAIYKKVTQIALENGISNITFFGPNDKWSWLGEQYKGTLYDKNNNKKLAYFAVHQSIYETSLK